MNFDQVVFNSSNNLHNLILNNNSKKNIVFGFLLFQCLLIVRPSTLTTYLSVKSE